MSQEDAADLIDRALHLAVTAAYWLEAAKNAPDPRERARLLAGIGSKCSRLAEAAFSAEEAANAARGQG